MLQGGACQLTRIGEFPNLRVLLWVGSTLYASSAYRLLKADTRQSGFKWIETARFRPAWWRQISSRNRMTWRLCRDGFHALVALHSGHFVGAVPGAIVALDPGQRDFRITHALLRGTRPLNIAADSADRLYWGEYFDNADRDEVYVYGSHDLGASWAVIYTFPKRSVRHVHNIIHDRWGDCFWVLTGDYESECRILRASRDWQTVEVVVSGNQQYRAVSLIATREALYFATDTPLELNYIYRMERSGHVMRLDSISSSSLYGCRVGNALFFSTMIEPSKVNLSREASIFGTVNDDGWSALLRWRKDNWPMRFFQYGNVILPAGENSTSLLAATPIAVDEADLTTSLWEVASPGFRRECE